jgi:hypothetical protein
MCNINKNNINILLSWTTWSDGSKWYLHRPGIEPGPPAWQASILPLNQRCWYALSEFKHINPRQLPWPLPGSNKALVWGGGGGGGGWMWGVRGPFEEDFTKVPDISKRKPIWFAFSLVEHNYCTVYMTLGKYVDAWSQTLKTLSASILSCRIRPQVMCVSKYVNKDDYVLTWTRIR